MHFHLIIIDVGFTAQDNMYFFHKLLIFILYIILLFYTCRDCNTGEKVPARWLCDSMKREPLLSPQSMWRCSYFLYRGRQVSAGLTT